MLNGARSLTIVSILAHLARWALLSATTGTTARLWFQSSPTSQGGRYAEYGQVSPRPWSFNPRPPRKVGATRSDPISRLRDTCFNPRPPRKVGATQLFVYNITRSGVSILAHLARWALLLGLC